MRITDNKWKPSHAIFVVNKDEWDTKEGRGKSMKNACTAVWQKAPLGLKQR